MAEREGFASSFVWAMAFVLAVGIVMGSLYYSGFLGGTKKQQIDVDIKVPSVSNSR